MEPPALVPDGEGFAVKDEEVNLDELINAPLPAVPLDVTYTGGLGSLCSSEFAC